MPLPLLFILSLMLLASCNPAVNDETSSQTDSLDIVVDGEPSIPLTIDRLQFTPGISGPRLIVIETTLPTEANVQLRLGGTLVEEIQTGQSCQVFPAVTICSEQTTHVWTIYIDTSGIYNLQLVANKEQQMKSLSTDIELPILSCIDNEPLFQQTVKPVLQENCGSCHSGSSNATAVFSTSDTWALISGTLINKGEDFYQAPSGQKPGHAAQPITPWSDEYRLLAELIYRVETNFQCD